MPEIQNQHIPKISTNGYVLKILNSKDSIDQDLVEAQNFIMNSITIPGVTFPTPVKNIHGKLLSLESISSDDSNQAKSGE